MSDEQLPDDDVVTDAEMFDAILQVVYFADRIHHVRIEGRGTHVYYPVICAGVYEFNIDSATDRRHFLDWSLRVRSDGKALP